MNQLAHWWVNGEISVRLTSIVNQRYFILQKYGIDLIRRLDHRSWPCSISRSLHPYGTPPFWILIFFFAIGPPERGASIRVGKGNSRSWGVHAGTQCQGSSVPLCFSDEPSIRQISLEYSRYMEYFINIINWRVIDIQRIRDHTLDKKGAEYYICACESANDGKDHIRS